MRSPYDRLLSAVTPAEAGATLQHLNHDQSSELVPCDIPQLLLIPAVRPLVRKHVFAVHYQHAGVRQLANDRRHHSDFPFDASTAPENVSDLAEPSGLGPTSFSEEDVCGPPGCDAAHRVAECVCEFTAGGVFHDELEDHFHVLFVAGILLYRHQVRDEVQQRAPGPGRIIEWERLDDDTPLALR